MKILFTAFLAYSIHYICLRCTVQVKKLYQQMNFHSFETNIFSNLGQDAIKTVLLNLSKSFMAIIKSNLYFLNCVDHIYYHIKYQIVFCYSRLSLMGFETYEKIENFHVLYSLLDGVYKNQFIGTITSLQNIIKLDTYNQFSTKNAAKILQNNCISKNYIVTAITVIIYRRYTACPS